MAGRMLVSFLLSGGLAFVALTPAYAFDWFFTNPMGDQEYPTGTIAFMGSGPDPGSKTLEQYKRNETTLEFQGYGFVDPNPVVTTVGMWSATGHGELTGGGYPVGRYRLLFTGDNQRYFDVVDNM